MIDPPKGDATLEELRQWLREFVENYNCLEDDVRKLAEDSKVDMR